MTLEYETKLKKEIEQKNKVIEELLTIVRKNKARTNAIKKTIKAVDDSYNKFFQKMKDIR